MSPFAIFALVSLCCSAGYLLGVTVRNMTFASQAWQFLRWDENIWGYRTVPSGYESLPQDRILLAVEVNPENFEVLIRGDSNDH